MNVAIYTDGASRGNPGRSASGYEIFKEGHGKVYSQAVYNGIKTNNFAEYHAVILALKKVLELFGNNCNVILYSDSKLIVNQLKGVYKIKDKYLKTQYNEARKLMVKFSKCELINVPRENKNIVIVDKSLNILLDKLERNSTDKKIKTVQKRLVE